MHIVSKFFRAVLRGFGGLLAALLCLLMFGFFDSYVVTPTTKLIASRNWVQVQDCEIVDADLYTWPARTYTEEFLPRVHFLYSWHSTDFLSRQVGFPPGRAWHFEDRSDVEREYPIGSRTACWVNPNDPREAVLLRDFSSRYLSANGLVAFGFMCLSSGLALWLWFSWVLALFFGDRESDIEAQTTLADIDFGETRSILVLRRFGTLTSDTSQRNTWLLGALQAAAGQSAVLIMLEDKATSTFGMLLAIPIVSAVMVPIMIWAQNPFFFFGGFFGALFLAYQAYNLDWRRGKTSETARKLARKWTGSWRSGGRRRVIKTDDKNWKSVVDALLSEASLAVIDLSERSPSLDWEVSRCVDRLGADRVLILHEKDSSHAPQISRQGTDGGIAEPGGEQPITLSYGSQWAASERDRNRAKQSERRDSSLGPKAVELAHKLQAWFTAFVQAKSTDSRPVPSAEFSALKPSLHVAAEKGAEKSLHSGASLPDTSNSNRILRRNKNATLWQGAPQSGFILRKVDIFAVPFSMLFLAFAVFFTVNAPELFFVVFGLVFVAVGLYVFVGRFFHDALLREKTSYRLTSDSIEIVCTLNSAKRRIVPLNSISTVSCSTRRNGRGTIFFGQPEFGSECYYSLSPWSFLSKFTTPKFEAIEDAEKVHKLALAAIRARSDELCFSPEESEG